MIEKNLYIIAGCNGAGKTTASFTILPEIIDCREFVNADEIAKGLSPFQPEKVAIQAGKIMLGRIDKLMQLQVNFAIETTLTTLSYQQTIAKARAVGYNVTLVFFWLNDVNLAIERVRLRVKEGGHHIPTETIKRRYKKGIKNLIEIFISICNKWIVIDNSEKKYILVAENGNKVAHVYDKKISNRIKIIANEKS